MAAATGVTEEQLRELLRKCNKCHGCGEICLEDFPVINCTADHRLCKPCFVKSVSDPCAQCKNPKPFKKYAKPAKLDVVCRFTPDGCSVMRPEATIKNHESECKFRTYECLGKTTNTFVCHWTGNQISLLDHFAQVHKQNWCNMSYKHESFIHGPQEEAKKFCYEMEFFIPEDPVSQLKFREICLPDTVLTSEILNSEKCVVLSSNLRKRYMVDNKLHYRFWIKTTDIFGKPCLGKKLEN